MIRARRAGQGRLCSNRRNAHPRRLLAALVVACVLARRRGSEAARAPTAWRARGRTTGSSRQLGNGGYDAEHYDARPELSHRRPERHSSAGRSRCWREATQSLSRFNLDFAGDSVGGVTVDGRRATWSVSGRGARDHARHRPMRRRPRLHRVAWTSSRIQGPAARCPSTPDSRRTCCPSAGSHTFDGSVSAARSPSSRTRSIPSNDHPSDKASYSFKLRGPERA